MKTKIYRYETTIDTHATNSYQPVREQPQGSVRG